MSKFKNETNQMLYRHLFFETCAPEHRDRVLYTLKRDDHKGYPSLYKLYMATDDITEYNFANTYFQDWQHWKKLTDMTWFKEYVSEWREELTVAHQAKALKQIKEEANKEDSKNKYAANKFLLLKGWEDKPTPITRTAKKKIKEAAQDITIENSDIDDDYKRIMN